RLLIDLALVPKDVQLDQQLARLFIESTRIGILQELGGLRFALRLLPATLVPELPQLGLQGRLLTGIQPSQLCSGRVDQRSNVLFRASLRDSRKARGQ